MTTHTPSSATSAKSESIDLLLVEELNKLSFQEREVVNEEIHGIDVRNVEELGSVEKKTEILNQAFHDLDVELKQLCATKGGVGEMAHAFDRSQKLFGVSPDQGTYLNTKEIRIMFIRCERFDCKKAAERICRFADMMRDLYGDICLERLPKLSDLDDEEMDSMKQGHTQLIPGRDRAGRRLYAHFDSNGYGTKIRISVYVMLAMVLNDEISQQRGIVVLVWMSAAQNKLGVNKFMNRGKNKKMLVHNLPIRLGAVHLYFPSIETYRTGPFGLIFLQIAKQILPHVRIHSGSPMEFIYILESFGIASHLIPVNRATFKLEVASHNRWLDLCDARERNNANLPEKIIDCPNNSDILFGRGRNYLSHPGNVMFRNFIQSNLQMHANIKSRKEMTQWTWDLFRTLRQEYGARFLKEENIGRNITTWVEVSNDVARMKIPVAFRDARIRLTKSNEKLTIATNAASRTQQTELDNCGDMEPLPLMQSEQNGGDIMMQDNDFPFSMGLLEHHQLLYSSLMDSKNSITTLNNNIEEFNSNVRGLATQQVSDSSTSAFLGMDVSDSPKRPRLCTPIQHCIENMDPNPNPMDFADSYRTSNVSELAAELVQEERFSMDGGSTTPTTKTNRSKGTLSPGQFDVLLGRGAGFHFHPGNIRLRGLIEPRVDEHTQCRTSEEKVTLTLGIVKEVHSKGGRFLKQTVTGWTVVTDHEARQKVSHTFRNIRNAANRKAKQKRKFF